MQSCRISSFVVFSPLLDPSCSSAWASAGVLNNLLQVYTAEGFFFFSAPQFQLCQWMLGLNPGLFLLSYWQSDALTTRLDLINFYYYYRYKKNETNHIMIFCTLFIRFYHFNS
jgi:hypothetical protein